MTEKLLQYIWQFQYFNRSSLCTINGEKIEVIHPGKLNRGQGPDFLNAQIRIGSTLLAGSVEVHHKTSQWNQHGHHFDSNYNNVILHVVHSHNENVTPHIPILELESRISMVLLKRYETLMASADLIPCSTSVLQVSPISWMSWKDRLIAERLSRKATVAFSFLKQNKLHWDETFWWMLARNFGSVTNAEAFEAIAKSLSLTLLAKHKHSITQLEALLFGQAGLLDADFIDEYPNHLKREYEFFQKKYGLKPVHTAVLFLRMRPGNFPTIRLAQLAGLIHRSVYLFSKMLEIEVLAEAEDCFNVSTQEYWNTHYLTDVNSAYKRKSIGKSMIHNLVINTVAPMLFAYGLHHRDEKYKEKALRWLEKLPPESNTITKGFEALGVSNNHAMDSQALIELKSHYCDARLCLSCSIGNTLLRHIGYNTERAFL